MKKTDKDRIKDLIQMFGLRKKQFAPVPRRLYPKLSLELSQNYPKAKFSYFALSGGKTLTCIRTSAAYTFKQTP